MRRSSIPDRTDPSRLYFGVASLMPLPIMPTMLAATPTPAFYDLASIQALVGDDLAAVDRTIRARLTSDVVLVNQIAEHIIGGGGKRLRPLLVLLAARALRHDSDRHIELAVIVEFIHTATLLHDDVVDDSQLRRGRNTANALFGNEAAVLVGDSLYSRAFQMMVAFGDMRVMQIMARTTSEIADGEVLQLLNRHDPDTTEANYLDVIHRKTAMLFEAAARLGAVCANAPPQHEDAMARFGRHLGTAYQLVDDVLDYRGRTGEIGKNVGDDLAEGKPTLPLIHAIRESSGHNARLLHDAIRTTGIDSMEEVIAAVESAGSIAYTARLAADEVALAGEALSAIPNSPYRDALAGLAEFTTNRSY